MKTPPPPPRGSPPLDLDGPGDDHVGTARMLDDGTLQLQLRTVTDDGMIGEALLIVPKGDARYASMVAHLDHLRPGQSCSIRPFPEPETDPDTV